LKVKEGFALGVRRKSGDFECFVDAASGMAIHAGRLKLAAL
jgi:hypothetical protein